MKPPPAATPKAPPAPAKSQAARPQPALRPDLVILGLVLFAATALHAAAITLPFFADDYLFLDQVRHRSLVAVLAAPDPIGNFFRPLGRQAYFWTLAHLTRQSPFAFHAVNFGLFLASVALLFSITRRMAGLGAAAIAGSIVALHYAADVPVRWVSGSQDLMATTGGLAALWLLQLGRRGWAGVALFLALLCKETVVLTPAIGVFAAREGREPWRDSVRRAWPLFAGAAAWAVLYFAMASRHRGAASPGAALAGVLPALVHLVQVTLGAEWRADAKTRFLHFWPPVVPLVIAWVAIFRARPRVVRAEKRPKKKERAARRAQGSALAGAAPPAPAATQASAGAGGGALLAGAVWALGGALPIAAVAPIWSAYFYLFALCGVGLLLGALFARGPAWRPAALVALLAWGSENGRRLDEFYTGPAAWSVESHVNRFYLDRAMPRIKRYLGHLKLSHPTMPHNTTIFFNGVPSFLAWQVADGPLVRWAYGDSSIHSYFMTEFSLQKAHHGPVYFLDLAGDTLRDRSSKPNFYKEMSIAMILADKFDPAEAALVYDLQRDSTDRVSKYWLGVVRLARGDTAGVPRLIAEAGLLPRPGPAPEVFPARARLAEGDTAGAQGIALRAVQRYALDPAAHAVLADAMVGRLLKNTSGAIEALAHRALAPEDPLAWRRWGYIQAISKRYLEAYTSLQHYFAIGGLEAARDTAAVAWLAELRKMQPGGELIQKGLRAWTGPGK